MDPVRNPFAPGAGLRPPELAGRDDDLDACRVALERLATGRAARGIVLVGLRGFGKTVLLNEYRALVADRAWIAAKVEAGSTSPFRLQMTHALHQSLRSISGRHGRHGRVRRALAVFKAFSLTVSPDGRFALGIDVDAAVGHADTGDLETDFAELLIDLGETARELGLGVALLIDEMQDLPAADLSAIASASHETAQRSLPVIVLGAGLPNLSTVLAEAKSYSDRQFEFREVAALDAAAARSALERPVEALGVTWSAEGLATAVAAAQGYPYFVQEFGKAIWDYAGRSPISGADARLGLRIAGEDLDVGFYRNRWDRASPAQQEYLHAVAIESESVEPPEAPVSTSAVAQRLGRTMSTLSSARDQLIRKGLLFAPDRGSIAFTVPGMAAYVRRQRGS